MKQQSGKVQPLSLFGEGDPRGGANRAPADGVPSIALHYRGEPATRIWGPITGRPYDFSRAQPVLQVDARDAAIIARGGLFHRMT